MKAVAIPYVIALILGVIIIGLLGYWFVYQGGKTTVAGSSAECQGKFFQYCLQWQTQDRNCDLTNRPPAKIIEGCGNPLIKSQCESLNMCK